MRKGLEKGHIHLILKGHKLKGEFSLVRLRGEQSKQWLLIKKKDAFASQEDVTKNSQSVISNRSLPAPIPKLPRHLKLPMRIKILDSLAKINKHEKGFLHSPFNI